MRVVVTGAAGSIGTVVTAGLAGLGHDVVALDRADFDAPQASRVVVADVLDAAAVHDAVDGAEAVVHLASIPSEASLPEILESHVHTTAVVLDAMVDAGAGRLVYASSNHAVGRTPRGTHVGADTPPRPDTFYGVGKVAAEALCRLYVDRHGLDIVACRIGSFRDRPESRRNLSTWLSHGDAVRMVEAGLTTPAPGFAVLYGISANTRAWWDLAPGRRLGYRPQDDAEQYADQVLAEPETDADRFEASYVGGPFAGDAWVRPAMDNSR
ncbi:MAG: NAD-dependent epimerase/dehydratase family protein [Propionibacteriales bacterium]|nr:NAD-dependent epimerase/dehydratase family protein [Propionibacteriales bacterium]